MALKLIYNDIIPGVAEGTMVSVSVEAENFSTPALLPFGANTGGIATLEPNGWGLTREYKVKKNQLFGFWSSDISDENGIFENPPVISATLSGQYVLSGITLVFSPDTGEWCREVQVALYKGDETVFSKAFVVDDANCDVEFKGGITFDKIVVLLNKTNIPHRRAKLELLKAGITRIISGKKIEVVNVIDEINLLADSIPHNVVDATFHTERQTNIVFQNGQNIELYEGDVLAGSYYIDKGQQDGQTVYSVSADDRMGLLEKYQYNPSYKAGDGIWFDFVPASEIMRNILGDEFDFELSPELENATLKGYCKEGTVSEAVRQVAFALGAFIDVRGSIVSLGKVQKNITIEIPPADTFVGGTIETMDMVTAVRVYSYDISDEHPDHVERPNYVQTPNGAYLYDRSWIDVSNPNVTETTVRNALMYEENYLISSDEQAANVANHLLGIHKRQRKYTFSHVDRGQRVGDYVRCYLPWGEPTSGIIIKKSIKYSGIKVSESTVLLDD